MNRVLKCLLLICVLVVIVSPVLAKTGGIKVDDDPSCDVDREDNALAPSCTSFIWLNLQQDSPGSYTCQICDNGVCSSCDSFSNSFNSCGDGYYWATFVPPSTEGSYTLVLSDSSGKNVSRDGFRVVSGEPCD